MSLMFSLQVSWEWDATFNTPEELASVLQPYAHDYGLAVRVYERYCCIKNRRRRHRRHSTISTRAPERAHVTYNDV